MKPFARINLSSVLSSVALAKGDALRRGRGKCCQCGSVANANTNCQ